MKQLSLFVFYGNVIAAWLVFCQFGYNYATRAKNASNTLGLRVNADGCEQHGLFKTVITRGTKDAQDEMISFNKPICLDESLDNIRKAAENLHISGDGVYTKRCHAWLEENTGTQKALLTVSCSAALEMAAHLCELKSGDEVILPSYTFSSTANAFINAGARLVFVDVRPDTLNIDEAKIEAAITERTRVICVVHYAGVACEMDAIMDIAHRHNLFVVEDAAQAASAYYHGKPLGSIGDFGCLSFHETKNYSMGEGGALLIRDSQYNDAAEILREKGTNRSRFFRGQVDKYTWVDFGSSYLPSDMNAAYLLPQLECAKEITSDRLRTWQRYYEELSPLQEAGLVELPTIPEGCMHNAHLFFVKLTNLEERTAFIAFLRDRGVQSTFHYIPLHSAPAGIHYGRFDGADEYTTRESERLTRLPLYYGLTDDDCATVIDAVLGFFAETRGWNA